MIYETNAAGGRVDKRYDALGRLIKTQGVNHSVANGPSGFYRSKFGRHETDFVYSIHGDLAQQHDIDSSGKTGSFDTNYALDARGRRISVTNGDGITTYYKYDAKGNTLSEKVRIDTKYSHWSGRTDNDYWLTKSYQYDKRGNQIRTDINGRAEQSSYNAFGGKSPSLARPGIWSTPTPTTKSVTSPASTRKMAMCCPSHMIYRDALPISWPRGGRWQFR